METFIIYGGIMCKFLSWITYEGKPLLFNAEQRKTETQPDSHSRIAEVFFGSTIKEDRCNKYEYVDGKLIVDSRPNEDEHIEDVQMWIDNFVTSAEFKAICIEELKSRRQSVDAIPEGIRKEVVEATNIGKGNAGVSNSGHSNSGDSNSGYYNSGNYNSGYCNSGSRNSGNYNSGNYNSGYCNSGSRNSGNYNSGYRNSGFFNTDEPTLRLFNKGSRVRRDDRRVQDILYIGPVLTKWVWFGDMTDDEKKEDPKAELRGGATITREYKQAWKEFWESASKETQKKFLNLPNFDAKIFFEITGIQVKGKK